MTESTVETIGRALADGLCRDDACAVLFTQLVRLLAEGQPVSHDRLTAALGSSREMVEATLHDVPNVDYDEQGCIVASGLSLLPHAPPVLGQWSCPLYLVRARYAAVSGDVLRMADG